MQFSWYKSVYLCNIIIVYRVSLFHPPNSIKLTRKKNLKMKWKNSQNTGYIIDTKYIILIIQNMCIRY